MPLQSVFAFALLKLRRTRFALWSSRGCATRSPKGEAWWAVTDSNRRHSACKADALPTELTAHSHRRWRDLSPRCGSAQAQRRRIGQGRHSSSSEYDTARLRAVGMAASRRAANAAGSVAGSATGQIRWSDRFLEFLGGAEGDLFAGLDLDGFAGGRIAAHARGAFADLQDAEPADADALALLEVLDDIADQAAKDGFSLLFRQLVILRKACRQVLQCHGSRWCLGCH